MVTEFLGGRLVVRNQGGVVPGGREVDDMETTWGEKGNGLKVGAMPVI